MRPVYTACSKENAQSHTHVYVVFSVRFNLRMIKLNVVFSTSTKKLGISLSVILYLSIGLPPLSSGTIHVTWSTVAPTP